MMSKENWLKAASHDSIFFLALFQLIEMSTRVSSFFEFEEKSSPKLGLCEPALSNNYTTRFIGYDSIETR